MSQPILRTQRLTLRPFRMDDVSALHSVLSDTYAMRYWGPHTSVEQTQDFVRSTISATPEGTCDFVIERFGKPIGKAGMWQRPEIGFFVHPAHQRQGLAREALTAIIPHLFATYPEPVLTADVDPRNHASTALLRGLGFRETGRAARTIEICGEWCDSVYFALDRPS